MISSEKIEQSDSETGKYNLINKQKKSFRFKNINMNIMDNDSIKQNK